jgi:hypothetical protein
MAISMAAVLCLMFLPMTAAVLFMIGSGATTLGAALAVATFTILAVGLVVGALKMSRDWPDESGDDHRA